MNDEFVIVIGGVEYPATIQDVQDVGATRVVVTPTQENFLEILAAYTTQKPPKRREDLMNICVTTAGRIKAGQVEYIGVILENTDVCDNIVWVKAGDYRIVEGQVVLHNILGKVRVALRTSKTVEGKNGVYRGIRIVKLALKHLRLPESSVVGLLRTTTNPLEA